MRLVVRILVGLASLLVGLLLVVLVASFVFNLSTDGGSKPVTALWDGKFVQAGPVLTAYRQWGTHGTPIVLVGGFVEPSFVWEKVGPLLARSGHRVYALDLDGFGYTQRHGPWTLEGWADQTAAFMRALGMNDPVVVGHSLGAAVAVELARRGLASRAVLVDGDALVSGGPSSFFRGLIASSPLVTSVVRIARRWDWPVEQVLREAYGPRHPKIDHALVARWTDPFRAAGAESAMNHIVDHGAQGFKLADLNTPRIRATVIWGSKDTVVPLASGEDVADALHARFVTILGAGHLSLLSHPRRVAAEILRDA